MSDFCTAEDGLNAATRVLKLRPVIPRNCLLPTAYCLLSTATAQVRAAGVESPRLDAELLLAHVLGVGRPWLLTHRDDVLPTSARATFEALIARRARGEPVAYLTGYRGWYDLMLRITPGT